MRFLEEKNVLLEKKKTTNLWVLDALGTFK